MLKQLLITIFFTIYCTGIAFFHARLTNALPEAESIMDQAPAEIRLVFSRRLDRSASYILLEDASGNPVKSEPIATLDGPQEQIAISVEAIPPGIYLVKWQASSLDRHRAQGSYRFTIATSKAKLRPGDQEPAP